MGGSMLTHFVRNKSYNHASINSKKGKIRAILLVGTEIILVVLLLMVISIIRAKLHTVNLEATSSEENWLLLNNVTQDSKSCTNMYPTIFKVEYGTQLSKLILSRQNRAVWDLKIAGDMTTVLLTHLRN
jgi:hypothetical protein